MSLIGKKFCLLVFSLSSPFILFFSSFLFPVLLTQAFQNLEDLSSRGSDDGRGTVARLSRTSMDLPTLGELRRFNDGGRTSCATVSAASLVQNHRVEESVQKQEPKLARPSSTPAGRYRHKPQRIHKGPVLASKGLHLKVSHVDIVASTPYYSNSSSVALHMSIHSFFACFLATVDSSIVPRLFSLCSFFFSFSPIFICESSGTSIASVSTQKLGERKPAASA